MKKSNIRTLDQFKDDHYGKAGTAKRDALESGYDKFKEKARQESDDTAIQNKAI